MVGKAFKEPITTNETIDTNHHCPSLIYLEIFSETS
uniref:Uncharacterized protein n=1 Tax=Populus trichocarpa TaxID=3694 RepID=A0A3N7G6Q2_POPTR